MASRSTISQGKRFYLHAGDRRLLLDSSEVFLGRSRKCAVVLKDASISRRHARIVQQDGEIILEDLGSTNGTFINGERLEGSAPVAVGDRLTLGESDLLLGVLVPEEDRDREDHPGSTEDDAEDDAEGAPDNAEPQAESTPEGSTPEGPPPEELEADEEDPPPVTVETRLETPGLDDAPDEEEIDAHLDQHLAERPTGDPEPPPESAAAPEPPLEPPPLRRPPPPPPSAASPPSPSLGQRLPTETQPVSKIDDTASALSAVPSAEEILPPAPATTPPRIQEHSEPRRPPSPNPGPTGPPGPPAPTPSKQAPSEFEELLPSIDDIDALGEAPLLQPTQPSAEPPRTTPGVAAIPSPLSGSSSPPPSPTQGPPAASRSPLAAEGYVHLGDKPPVVKKEFLPAAGFWVRFGAALIDAAVVFVLSVGLSFLIGGPTTEEGGLLASGLAFALAILIPIFGWSIWGTSPGKRLLGLYVCDLDGGPGIGAAKAVLRLVAYAFSALALGLGFLMIAFTASKRGLHDVIAGTYVGYKE